MPFIIFPQAYNKLAVIMPCGAVEDSIKDVPAGVEYTIVDSLEGVDNEYFDGFVYEDGVAVADISACKKIHLDKFRSARIPKFNVLDLEFIKAIEQSDVEKQTEITAQKQALRDVTKTPLPNTLPEIKAVWPDILK